VNLHGPSLGIGAGIAAVAIFVTFLAFDNITDEKELVLEQAENIQSTPQKIGLEVFTENGSHFIFRTTQYLPLDSALQSLCIISWQL